VHADLISLLAPIGAHLHTLDLSAPDHARAALDAAFPADRMAPVTAALLAAHAAGALTPKEGGPNIRFGRVSKSTPETHHHSLDAVDIAGAGAPHTHPRGEVSWCVPLEGAPVFEGVPSGWAVLPPGSHHTPTVTGGRMLIVYWLPGGEVAWG
jgi:hypothetical protein